MKALAAERPLAVSCPCSRLRSADIASPRHQLAQGGQRKGFGTKSFAIALGIAGVHEGAAGPYPGLPVIVTTAQGIMEAAIAALRVGAFDFLIKPVNAGSLGLAIARAVQHRRLSKHERRQR